MESVYFYNFPVKDKPLLGLSNISCGLAEKEIPILVKQEPVETKELIFEADKVPKSRYKKVMPPVPPSPVSRHQKSLFSLIQHDEKSTLSFYRLTKCAGKLASFVH